MIDLDGWKLALVTHILLHFLSPVIPIYIVFFLLQAQFAQMQAPGGMSPLASGIPGYHHGAPRLGPQQLYYGQGTPGLMPPQAAGYGFQQQVFPGLRPGGPNYIMPYHLQRQVHPGQRTGVRRSGNTHQMQQPQVH